MAEVKVMSPQETAKWCSSLALCGVKGRVLHDLQDQILRRQIDGALFDHMLRSNTLIDLGIEEINAKMALAIRRSWTTDFGKQSFAGFSGDSQPQQGGYPGSGPPAPMPRGGGMGGGYRLDEAPPRQDDMAMPPNSEPMNSMELPGGFRGACLHDMQVKPNQGLSASPAHQGGYPGPVPPVMQMPRSSGMGGGFWGDEDGHAGPPPGNMPPGPPGPMQMPPRSGMGGGYWADEDPYLGGGHARHPMHAGMMPDEMLNGMGHDGMPGPHQMNCRGQCQQPPMPSEVDFNGKGGMNLGMPRDGYGGRPMQQQQPPPPLQPEDMYNGRSMLTPPQHQNMFNGARGGRGMPQDPYLGGGHARHPMHAGMMPDDMLNGMGHDGMPGPHQMNCRGQCQQPPMPSEVDYNGKGGIGLGMPRDGYGGRPMQQPPPPLQPEDMYNGRSMLTPPQHQNMFNGGRGGRGMPQDSLNGRGFVPPHDLFGGDRDMDVASQVSDMRDSYGRRRGSHRTPSPAAVVEFPVRAPGVPLPADLALKGSGKGKGGIPLLGGMRDPRGDPGWDAGGYPTNGCDGRGPYPDRDRHPAQGHRGGGGPCDGHYGRGVSPGDPDMNDRRAMRMRGWEGVGLDEAFAPRRPAATGYPPEENYRPSHSRGRGAMGPPQEIDPWGGGLGCAFPPASATPPPHMSRGGRYAGPQDEDDMDQEDLYLAQQAVAAQQRRPEARAREAQRQANAEWGGMSLGDALSAKRPQSRGESRGGSRRDNGQAHSQGPPGAPDDAVDGSDAFAHAEVRVPRGAPRDSFSGKEEALADPGRSPAASSAKAPLRRVPREPQVPDNGWGGQSLSDAFAPKKAASGGSSASNTKASAQSGQTCDKSVKDIVAWVRSLPDGHVPEKSRECIAAIVEERGLDGNKFTEFVRTVPPEVCGPRHARKLDAAWSNVLAEAAAIEVAASNFQANQEKPKATMLVFKTDAGNWPATS